MNNLLKKIYYTLFKPELAQGYNLSLGFIFHTEKIYDEVIFNRLLTFCKEFQSITGKRVLCTIMPPVSFRVNAEMQQSKATEEKFIENLKTLQHIADLGFHGHFWRSATEHFESPENQIRNSVYQSSDDDFVKQQFTDQVKWFKQTNFTPVKSYAAGWWFTHRIIMQLQAWSEIVYDFSFSKLKWTSGTWGKTIMHDAQLAFGEPFVLEVDGRKIECIQTVMGTPNTKFPQDFIRIINAQLESANKMPMGMITTHDYDLDGDNLKYAIAQIRYLKTLNNIQFFSQEDLPVLLRERQIKSIKI